MESKQELYQVVCLSGGMAAILFGMVHSVLMPSVRIYEATPEFQQITFSIPRKHLFHEVVLPERFRSSSVSEVALRSH